MENKKKKRIYDEKNLGESELTFKSSSPSNEKSANISIKEDKSVSREETKEKTVFDKAATTIRKADRAIDSVLDSDYKDFKGNSKGLDNISQFTDAELKYLKRDFKIEGRDTSDISSEFKMRSAKAESVLRDQNVKLLYDIKTDKGDIKIGYDQKRGVPVISENKFDNNPNINIWRKMDKGDLAGILINKGELKNFDMNSKPRNIESANVPKETKSFLNVEIAQGMDRSQAINFTKDLTSTDLRNPERLTGSIINTAEKGKEPELYKVLQADKDNLTLRGLNTDDDRAFMVSVDAERKSALNREVELSGIIDSKTVLGFNEKDNDVYIGTVNNDQSINWEQKGVFLNNQDKGKKEQIAARIENGDYIRDNVKTVGIIDQGNSLYGATNGNKDTLISANQSDWYSPDSIVGKQLASLAGLETGAISALMNVDKTAQLVNSNQVDNGMSAAAESQSSKNYSNQQRM